MWQKIRHMSPCWCGKKIIFACKYEHLKFVGQVYKVKEMHDSWIITK